MCVCANMHHLRELIQISVCMRGAQYDVVQHRNERTTYIRDGSVYDSRDGFPFLVRETDAHAALLAQSRAELIL